MNNGECLIDALRNKEDSDARKVIEDATFSHSQYCPNAGCEHIRSSIESAQVGKCLKGYELRGLVKLDEQSVRPYDRELLRIDD